ncbi:MAG: GreA/GreB family elongation factor [Ghiorsea sp.]|nr:GreA/GreB family elongation factor [Ghiorsea sp.]
MNKQNILSQIINQLEADIQIAQQAVDVARDTATHKDCLGSSKYETMGTEASYLAKGQGERLLELHHALAYFKQVQLTPSSQASLSSLVSIKNETGKQQSFWLAADAGGLKIVHEEQNITVITPQAPLGRALLGKKVGDVVEIKAANKSTEYEVVGIL